MQLTVGLLRAISKGYYIPALELFLKGRDDNDVLDLLNRNDYIATKLWSREDIESKINELGYEASDENIDNVINSGYLKTIEDCTEQDWDIIEFAIKKILKN